MKKVTVCLLCAALVMSLFSACGGEETAGKKIEQFSVGYAKANITPECAVPLGGYGDHDQRISKGFLEPLYATCVAFADPNGEKLLFISHDLGGSRAEIFTPLRERIAEENGIPVSRVLFTASHSHSSPYVSSIAFAGVKEYIELVKERIAEGAKAALADLSPATMETGFQRVDRLNTVRHYLLTDGSYQGRAVGTLSKDKLIGHYGQVDNLLQVVKFTREDGKKPVVLVNWCGHPTGMAGDNYYYASPNYVGALRDALSEKYDCEVSYVLSGSGNVNNGSQIAGELDHEKGDYKKLGELLAGYAGEILDGKLTPGKADAICVSENLFVAKNKSGIDQQVPLYAFSVGDWACVTAPFEIFDTNAMAVRDASKFYMTFYASCANGAMGYLPTPPSFDWEITYEAEITKFPKGMAEMVQGELTRQLDEIFVQSGNVETEKPEGYLTPEFVPFSDDVVYQNPAPGQFTLCHEVKNGFYAMTLFEGTDMKNILCLDRETAEKVVSMSFMKLIYNEQNVVIDAIAQ